MKSTTPAAAEGEGDRDLTNEQACAVLMSNGRRLLDMLAWASARDVDGKGRSKATLSREENAQHRRACLAKKAMLTKQGSAQLC